MEIGSGPEALPQLEDRLLYHLLTLTGDRPITLSQGVSEADLAVHLAAELGIDPAFARSPEFHLSQLRGMLITAVQTLESEGLVSAIKVAGPWRIIPTRDGRRRVAEWQATWEQRRRSLDKAVQQRILEELDRQRRADPTRHQFSARIDVKQLCAEFEIGHADYLAFAHRLLEQGKIARHPNSQDMIENGHASITEAGIRTLETAAATQRPQRDSQEAWVEVARLRRQLQLAERSLPSLISDPELRQRCADLLTAEGYYDRAIREACVILEDRVRMTTGAAKELIGTALMEHAFGTKAGPLRVSTHDGEQLGGMQIYRGIMALFRNAAGHNLIDCYTQEDAIRFVVCVDLLLKMAAQARGSSPPGSTL